MAPTYANIFMWNLDKYLLDNCTNKPFLYLCYIYDIFVIWQQGEDKLGLFHEYVNSIHPNIKLTSTSSANNISYHDVSASLDDTNIHTSIYTKSTDRHRYLHYKGIHPIHIKKSIVYYQFIGYKRICSDKFTLEHQASNIFLHFINKDYPFKLIYNEFRKVCHIDRNNLLKYSHKTNTNNIPNIYNFHPTIQKFNQDIKNVWRNFEENPSTGKLFKTPPIVTYRQPPNHKHILICSKVKNITTTLQGNFKCDTKRCQICYLIDTRPSFTLPRSTSIVKPGSFSCNSSNAVYLITCNKCCNGEVNYIGETSTKY